MISSKPNSKKDSKKTAPTKATYRSKAIGQPSQNPSALIQQAHSDIYSLTANDILQLQRTIGNRAVGRLLERKTIENTTVPNNQIQTVATTTKTIQRKNNLAKSPTPHVSITKTVPKHKVLAQNSIQRCKKGFKLFFNLGRERFQYFVDMRFIPYMRLRPLFFRESIAGLAGYFSHFILPPVIPHRIVQNMSPQRLYFHNLLQQLYNDNLANRWAHQLMWQNARQSQFGGGINNSTAEHMVDYLRQMGQEASGRGRRTELLRLFYHYQMRSIPLFERGGSSYAPRLLHSLGMILQGPAILMMGPRWVNRSAPSAVLRSPLAIILVFSAAGVFVLSAFRQNRFQDRESKEEKSIEKKN